MNLGANNANSCYKGVVYVPNFHTYCTHNMKAVGDHHHYVNEYDLDAKASLFSRALRWHNMKYGLNYVVHIDMLSVLDYVVHIGMSSVLHTYCTHNMKADGDNHHYVNEYDLDAKASLLFSRALRWHNMKYGLDNVVHIDMLSVLDYVVHIGMSSVLSISK